LAGLGGHSGVGSGMDSAREKNQSARSLNEKARRLADGVRPDIVVRQLPVSGPKAELGKFPARADLTQFRVREDSGTILVVDRDIVDRGPVTEPSINIGA
jgi:hypothetical protein